MYFMEMSTHQMQQSTLFKSVAFDGAKTVAIWDTEKSATITAKWNEKCKYAQFKINESFAIVNDLNKQNEEFGKRHIVKKWKLACTLE